VFENLNEDLSLACGARLFPNSVEGFPSALRRRASWYSGRGVAHVECFLSWWLAGSAWFQSTAAEQVIRAERE
jgi:hypothetical protein